MPAPSRKALYNFKGNLKAACLALNIKDGLTDSYLERATAFVKQKARIDIGVAVGEGMNLAGDVNGDQGDETLLVYDYFTLMLRFRVVTARREDQASAVSGIVDLHDEFIATLLTTYENRTKPFERTDTSLGASLLPWYRVKGLKPMGTPFSELDLVNFADFTDVIFSGELGIRSDAWPST